MTPQHGADGPGAKAPSKRFGPSRRAKTLMPGGFIFARADKIKGVPARPWPGGAEADVLYGVTMQEQGVTRILTINLNDVEKELNIK